MGGGDVKSDAAATESTVGAEEVSVNIRCSNGSKFTVKVSLDSTVRSFKDVLAQNCEVPSDQQRLIYKGRILKDDQTLQSYGLEADHTVHLVRGFAPSSPVNSAGSTNPEAPSTTPGNTRGVSSNNGGSNFGDSLFPGLGIGGLGGTGGLFGAGLPDFEQVQQQLAQNPNMMRDIMNLPLVQSLVNNPETMRSLIMNNPQMREIIDRNPELGHVLNDPSILRQTLEAARNPELMREMMRNTDRAMSNIESSPEGFNMLRRMYENVQEPFLNATMPGNNGGDGLNPFAALLGTQGGGQATDPSTNTSNSSSDTTRGSSVPNANPLPNPWTPSGTGRGQNNTTRSNPVGGARPQAPVGLAGLGLPGLEGILGSVPDSPDTSLLQMMQNPAITQMMQSILSNPQYMNQMFNLNPQLRSILDSNSQMREMLQNPEFLRQLTSPETLQQMLAVQQSLLSQLGRQQSAQQEQGQTGGGTGTLNNAALESLMNMFGGLGTGNPLVPNRSVPPEELYATQLSQLQEMGFFDTQENLRALIATAGNVHAAVERLLGNSGQ